MESAQSPANQLFNVYELVEALVRHLPSRTTIHLLRLNKVTNSVIYSSPHTKVAVFCDFFSSAAVRQINHGKYYLRALELLINFHFIQHVPGGHVTERTHHVMFFNKSQARAVLLKSRIQIAASLTLGQALKYAAKIVLDDECAWDPDDPKDNLHSALPANVPSWCYLRFFTFHADENAELDVEMPELEVEYDSRTKRRHAERIQLVEQIRPWKNETLVPIPLARPWYQMNVPASA